MPDPGEVELKLEVAPGDVARLRRHPLLAGLGRPVKMVSTYWDTPDLVLRDAGLTLRIRTAARSRIQTLKTASEGVGLFARGEWETPVAADRLDLDALDGTPVEALLKGGAARTLEPCFRIRVARASRLVERPDGAVELTLDQGAIEAGGREQGLTEVELELKSGPARLLFDLGRELMAVAPLRLSAVSKGEAGYELLRAPGPVKASDPRLDRGMTTAEAFQVIGRACLAQFLRNERLVRRSGAPEAVHQARVGLRRLRAAVSVFGDMLDDPQSAHIKEGLKALASALGAVRDLDVLLPRLAELKVSPPFDRAALLEALRLHRAEVMAEAVPVLASAEAARVAFDAAAWLEAGDWLALAPAALRDRPVADFAAEALERRAAKLRKALKRIRSLDAEGRHEVRIRAKKVRYAAEFFAGLADGKKPAKAARRFIRALKPLQEALGDLNDVANAERLLRALAGSSRDTAVAFAAGQAADAVGRAEPRLLQEVAEAAGEFAEAELFLG
jgi:inorganic triphosphatase YgiF